jgi:hypothetical protein
LSEAEILGRARHVHALGDGDENSELLECHGHFQLAPPRHSVRGASAAFEARNRA